MLSAALIVGHIELRVLVRRRCLRLGLLAGVLKGGLRGKDRIRRARSSSSVGGQLTSRSSSSAISISPPPIIADISSASSASIAAPLPFSPAFVAPGTTDVRATVVLPTAFSSVLRRSFISWNDEFFPRDPISKIVSVGLNELTDARSAALAAASASGSLTLEACPDAMAPGAAARLETAAALKSGWTAASSPMDPARPQEGSLVISFARRYDSCEALP